MSVLYLDTNALVKLVLTEPESERVEQAAFEAGTICSSVIAYAEARATIARQFVEKARLATEGDEDNFQKEHQDVITEFNSLWQDVNAVDVTPEISLLAGDLTVAHPGLRGMDALHLASVLYVNRQVPVHFITFDERLRMAAIAVLGQANVSG